MKSVKHQQNSPKKEKKKEDTAYTVISIMPWWRYGHRKDPITFLKTKKYLGRKMKRLTFIF